MFAELLVASLSELCVTLRGNHPDWPEPVNLVCLYVTCKVLVSIYIIQFAIASVHSLRILGPSRAGVGPSPPTCQGSGPDE